MLTEFLSWWMARLQEILPATLTRARGGRSSRVVVEVGPEGGLTAYSQRQGRQEALTLGAVSRLAGRRMVVLRAPPHMVLEKAHVTPTASRADMDQMLRHELARITPFAADGVYWRWHARPRPHDRGRSDIHLTLVPKIVLAPVLNTLAAAGIRPALLETASDPPRILSLRDDEATYTRRLSAARVLVWLNLALCAVVLLYPFLAQELALYRVQRQIDALQPTVSRVEALRRGLNASAAGNDIVTKELARTGDALAVLAAVTQVLPDDSYLTDLSLRQRQLTIGGRSASAPNLITALAANPMFRNTAFAAPVTRLTGSALDIFSIRAEIAAP